MNSDTVYFVSQDTLGPTLFEYLRFMEFYGGPAVFFQIPVISVTVSSCY